jgi:hypothetical protein
MRREGGRIVAANDTQIGGDHYRTKQYQPWDVMRDWMTAEQYSGFLLGAIIKYVARYRDKSGVEDLKKARHFLDKLIESESEPKPLVCRQAPEKYPGASIVRCTCKDTYEVGSGDRCPLHEKVETR